MTGRVQNTQALVLMDVLAFGADWTIEITSLWYEQSFYVFKRAIADRTCSAWWLKK